MNTRDLTFLSEGYDARAYPSLAQGNPTELDECDVTFDVVSPLGTILATDYRYRVELTDT